MWLNCFSYRLQAAIKTSFNSRYFYACVLYCTYALSFVIADCISDVNVQNQIFLWFSVVHVIDSLLFAFSWNDRSFFDIIIIPDYLNIICSVLWLWSATTYNNYYSTPNSSNGVTYTDDFYMSRKIELAATTFEMAACFGWLMAWYVEFMNKYGNYLDKFPTRGLTFRDPDFNANGWSIFFPAILYLVYEIQVYMNPASYEYNYLYVKADILYFLNSLFYLLGCIRDHGWYYSEGYNFEEYCSYTPIEQTTSLLIVRSYPEHPIRTDFSPI